MGRVGADGGGGRVALLKFLLVLVAFPPIALLCLVASVVLHWYDAWTGSSPSDWVD